MAGIQSGGYLSSPSVPSDKGVLVLHAWWGLNDTIKAFCDRLSRAGFVAFAPDLYHGKLATTIPKAENLRNELDDLRAVFEVAAAARYLNTQTSSQKGGLAVMGFSMGASFAVDLSVREAELIRSVVLFYGTGRADFSHSKSAYQGHFAEYDPYESRAEVDTMEADLRSAGRPVNFFHYPLTRHWFFEPDRIKEYHPDAAHLAWERVLNFLERPPE